MKEKETNRERFVRIAEARTQKIIDMIELLGNCSNQYNYEYTQKDVEKMNGEEIDHDLTFKDKLSSNLNILDRKITKIAESINTILAEYNKTVKSYNEAKEKYKVCKDAYDKEIAEQEPKMKEIQKKLSALAKDVDSALMEKYNAMRKDKKYPVFVPLLNNNACGHCRMELSASAVAKLNNEGSLTCEHCRCVIYKK